MKLKMGCAKCDKPAKYKSTFIGREKLVCKDHAEEAKRKNSSLPPDLWNLKKINEK